MNKMMFHYVYIGRRLYVYMLIYIICSYKYSRPKKLQNLDKYEEKTTTELNEKKVNKLFNNNTSFFSTKVK